MDDFPSRRVEAEYPFLWNDALYDEVPVEERVATRALMIAHGVNGAGNREILAREAKFGESKDS